MLSRFIVWVKEVLSKVFRRGEIRGAIQAEIAVSQSMRIAHFPQHNRVTVRVLEQLQDRLCPRPGGFAGSTPARGNDFLNVP